MYRKQFVSGTAAVAAGPILLSNQRPTVSGAIVSVQGRTREHIRLYSAMANVVVAAPYLMDENVPEKRLREIESAGQKPAAGYADYRKLPKDRIIDSVSIATPGYCHAWQAIPRLDASKGVYIERPCSHDGFRSQQLIAAVRKYPGRIVAHGMNSRSSLTLKVGFSWMCDAYSLRSV